MDRRFDNPIMTSREIDRDGFLHLPVRVIGIGRLSYDEGEELVSLENIKDEEFLKSIQGKPIVRDEHQWKSPADMTGVIGNFSGTPEIKDGFVVCDAIITDKKAIDDIENGLLLETSAGYRTDVGNDAIQRNLRCNHLVICEKGRARGGREMRVGNTKSDVGSEKNQPVPKRKIKIRVNVKGRVVKPAIRENRVNIGNRCLNKIETFYLALTGTMREASRHLEDLQDMSLSENDRVTIRDAWGNLEKLRQYEQIGMRRFSEIVRDLRRASL